MAIKISYSDEATGQILAEDIVSNEEIKALSTDMICRINSVVFFEFHHNAIHNKARQMIDKVCEQALNDQTDTILTKKDKQSIVAQLTSEGYVFPMIKQMPITIKLDIIKMARVKPASERETEEGGDIEHGD